MKKKFSKQYNKMMKRYQKEAKKLGKECKPWDWQWSAEFVINHLKWMKEYYTLNENVNSQEPCGWNPAIRYTRLEMIDQILEAYNELNNYTFTSLPTDSDAYARNVHCVQLRHKIFALIEKYMHELWD